MARKGTGYFDRKGHFFKNAKDATASDLAAILGQIGDGESLAPGIAHLLIERRADIERLFAEHDTMLAEDEETKTEGKVTDISDKLPKGTARPAV
ncbi:hypothetical protein [Erythrobacter sp. HL-111]|uniref:hypothetical protein n=1 Tax=Erythrobacter sp. HL-111 TaxID=1798193 RepID=UPI0006DB055E|nr:hypothetical protein [Erythrobacter sp. HL-111]KPP90306.1 MAG: hypothetical protein HLUCCO15_09695 [Erythrobacteraceae bacterium HL-111]SDR83656.1 hypothetical protein SAMN04515621_0474 [Erythrobacter sp. HL-111]